MSTAPPCRGFEERLVALGPDALAGDAHAAACAGCARLLDDVLALPEALASLARPVPTPALARRILEIPRDLPARAETEAALRLLEEGTLRAPDPDRGFLARLTLLPTRARAARAAAVARPGLAGSLARFASLLVGDWRITVAAAYGMALILVVVLRVDPMSAARGTAAGISSAGERAIAEARDAAERRLGAARLSTRFDYRIYRAAAVSRARAVAYSQLVVERIFGQVEVTSAARERKGENLRS